MSFKSLRNAWSRSACAFSTSPLELKVRRHLFSKTALQPPNPHPWKREFKLSRGFHSCLSCAVRVRLHWSRAWRGIVCAHVRWKKMPNVAPIVYLLALLRCFVNRSGFAWQSLVRHRRPSLAFPHKCLFVWTQWRGLRRALNANQLISSFDSFGNIKYIRRHWTVKHRGRCSASNFLTRFESIKKYREKCYCSKLALFYRIVV